MFKGSCHCNLVKWTLTGEIENVTACNCTVCRRYGTLWAYGFKNENIIVDGETQIYSRGGKNIGFHFCKNCGCVAYWLASSPDGEGKFRIAVNTRLILNPELIQSKPILHFDGLDKFEDEPIDHRCVKDMWY